MTNQINNSDVTFNVGKIKVTVHAPSIKTTDEENKRQLAQYLYKLVEMDNKAMQYKGITKLSTPLICDIIHR